MQNNEINAFRRKGDLGFPLVIALFVLATILGWVVFKNYEYSSKQITSSLAEIQSLSPQMTIEDCATNTMDWFQKCDSMTQLCDDTVSRMIKVCLANGHKSQYCSKYGKDVFNYNFGVQQCRPYMTDKKLKRQKKACADIWQSVADYCKAVSKKSVR